MKTRDLREKAARFYLKSPTGIVLDWIEGWDDGGEVDPDIKDLTDLLQTVYDRGVRDGKASGDGPPPAPV